MPVHWMTTHCIRLPLVLASSVASVALVAVRVVVVAFVPQVMMPRIPQVTFSQAFAAPHPAEDCVAHVCAVYGVGVMVVPAKGATLKTCAKVLSDPPEFVMVALHDAEVRLVR